MGTRRVGSSWEDVGRGMLVASVGLGTALDMGLAPAWADDEGDGRLTFGGLEPLVGLMQETAVDRLVPVLVEKLRAGTELKSLVAAAALANARTFGGEDYVGFHTLMALAPAYHMTRELPEDRRALPVLKVLYRNTNRIQEHGGRASEVLHAVKPGVALGRVTTRARPSARRSAGRTWTGPRAPSPRSPRRARPTRRSTACSSPSRTTPRSTASSCPIAPGSCSTSWAGSRPTRCSASRSATASRASRRRSTGRSDRRAPHPPAAAVRPAPPAADLPRHEAARRRVGRVDVPDDLRVEPGDGRRRRGRGAGRGDRPGRHRRGDLAGRQPARAPRRRPPRALGLAGQAAGERPRRLGRRPRERRGQRLAEHGRAWPTRGTPPPA